MGFPNHQIFSQVLQQFDKAMIKPSSPINLGDPTCLKKNRSNRSDGRLYRIYSNIYLYIYVYLYMYISIDLTGAKIKWLKPINTQKMNGLYRLIQYSYRRSI